MSRSCPQTLCSKSIVHRRFNHPSDWFLLLCFLFTNLKLMKTQRCCESHCWVKYSVFFSLHLPIRRKQRAYVCVCVCACVCFITRGFTIKPWKVAHRIKHFTWTEATTCICSARSQTMQGVVCVWGGRVILLDLSKHAEGDDNRDKHWTAPWWQVWNATVCNRRSCKNQRTETKGATFSTQGGF